MDSLAFLEKRIVKIAIIIPAIIIVLLATKAYKYYHPELNRDAVKFFIEDKPRIPDHENVAFSMLGFYAPPEVSDIHQFGIDLVKDSLNHYAGSDHKHIPENTRPLEVENKIALDVDIDKLFCWFDSANIRIDKLSGRVIPPFIHEVKSRG